MEREVLSLVLSLSILIFLSEQLLIYILFDQSQHNNLILAYIKKYIYIFKEFQNQELFRITLEIKFN